MRFDPPLQEARLLRRYQRFLADVRLPSGVEATLHCPNTGSMLGCRAPGSRVWFSDSGNSQRKYPWTWELVEVDGGHLAGINTQHPNRLVEEAIAWGVVEELQGYTRTRREVRYGAGDRKSRIDLLLERGGERCFVEVKNVTLAGPDGCGLFPDAVTARGAKHLRELIEVHGSGDRAVLFFCVQHTGIDRVQPADEIDPEYGRLLRAARTAGVEVIAYRADLSPSGFWLRHPLPVVFPRD